MGVAPEMRKSVGVAIAAVLAVGSVSGAAEVKVVPDEARRRVDVTVDGKPFTAYIWPDTLKKPVLYPVRSARGTLVTRGWPLDPRPGERMDHPHHVGLWFNYGDVDGVDYWNNSDAIKAEDRPHMGTIQHRRIASSKSGQDRGELVVASDWIRPDGTTAIHEKTRYVFGAGPDWRSIDRITTLTAGDKQVVFNDNKEGVLGMRVARGLEQPSKTPEIYTDSQGRATTVPVLNNDGVTGTYLSSEGKKADDVWGTRGRWVSLAGTVDGEPVTILMLDHPQNPGFPTYWHARGYGLFAANPLGQKVFSNGKEELKYTLPGGRSTTFRHRILILSGTPTPAQAEARYREFTSAAH
jgi:hypothetical protein